MVNMTMLCYCKSCKIINEKHTHLFKLSYFNSVYFSGLNQSHSPWNAAIHVI